VLIVALGTAGLALARRFGREGSVG